MMENFSLAEFLKAIQETEIWAGEHEISNILFQTALDDNYVAYELNATTRAAPGKAKIYSDLHANILDRFHGAGIEITSPHYRAVRDGNEIAIPNMKTGKENS